MRAFKLPLKTTELTPLITFSNTSIIFSIINKLANHIMNEIETITFTMGYEEPEPSKLEV